MASLDNLVLEKKNSSINASAVMLFLYSMVVSFALVLVITKNFETEEEILSAIDNSQIGTYQSREKRNLIPTIHEDLYLQHLIGYYHSAN